MAKSAIVTGASGGIGRAVAKRLADDGFAVVVNYAGNAARADDVVAEITAAGGRALSVQADVASAPDVARLFKQAGDAFGKSDVVVHCAGIMPLRPIADGDLDMFDKVIATNLRGAFVGTRRGGQAGAFRRTHHRLLDERDRQGVSRLRRLHRFESRCRRARARAGQ